MQVGDKAVQSPFAAGGSLSIRFPAEAAPSALSFVLKQGEQWTNLNGADFRVPVADAARGGSARAADALAKVCEAEGSWSHFTLFQRFCMALQLAPGAESADPDTLAVLFAQLRYSANRQLPWRALPPRCAPPKPPLKPLISAPCSLPVAIASACYAPSRWRACNMLTLPMWSHHPAQPSSSLSVPSARRHVLICSAARSARQVSSGTLMRGSQ